MKMTASPPQTGSGQPGREVFKKMGSGSSFIQEELPILSVCQCTTLTKLKALPFSPQGHVSFKPSLDQQRSCPTCTDSLLNGDFTIVYDVNRESPGNVQVELDGSIRLAC
jgi:hypothetical protein